MLFQGRKNFLIKKKLNKRFRSVDTLATIEQDQKINKLIFHLKAAFVYRICIYFNKSCTEF
jgi:hypothetical protein